MESRPPRSGLRGQGQAYKQHEQEDRLSGAIQDMEAGPHLLLRKMSPS